MINLISSDEDGEAPIIHRKRQRSDSVSQPFPTKLKTEKKNPQKSDDNGDIEIVSHVIRGASSSAPKREKIVDPFNGPITNRSKQRTRILSPPRALTSTKETATIGGGGGEAIELVGVTRGVQALVDYPHFRFQCALEAFKRARAAKKEKFCPRCYCYVCDVLASECQEWVSHSKAVDTVPRWRAKRETKLEERKRREQCLDTQKRGTVFSRYSVPQLVNRRGDEDDSEDEEREDGEISEDSEDEAMNSSDAMEWNEDCHPSDNEDDDENYKMCTFDESDLGMDKVVLEKDCFQMGGIDQLLQNGLLVERSADIRKRNPVLDGSLPGF